MRYIIFIVCAILLIASALAKPSKNASRQEQKGNYYAQTIHSWEGGNAATIVKYWGRPDRKLAAANGETYYIYETQSYPFAVGPASPQIGVSARPGGGAIITTTPSTNYSWSRGSQSANCITVFEVNRQGKILRSQSRGFCYGDEHFLHTKANPNEP